MSHSDRNQKRKGKAKISHIRWKQKQTRFYRSTSANVFRNIYNRKLKWFISILWFILACTDLFTLRASFAATLSSTAQSVAMSNLTRGWKLLTFISPPTAPKKHWRNLYQVNILMYSYCDFWEALALFTVKDNKIYTEAHRRPNSVVSCGKLSSFFINF